MSDKGITDYDMAVQSDWSDRGGTMDDIRRFNEKHGCTAKNQGLQLNAEVGELSDEILKQDKEALREEIGDVLFVTFSIAELRGIDPLTALSEVTAENMKKDATKKGEKVTKSKEIQNFIEKDSEE